MNTLVITHASAGPPERRPEPSAGSYTLGSGLAERQRLRQQQAVLGGHSSALLDRVSMRPGWSAVDLGCGPAGILDLLSARAGPAGDVTGVDVDADNVAAARAFARQHGLGNVRVITGDARRTALPGGTFDFVHTRLVLVNISQPADVIAEMARLARPGGWVAALEADILGLCYPPNPAVDQLAELLVAAIRRDGADPHLGRRLPEMFREAGLTDVRAEARTDAYEAGHPQRAVLLDLVRAMRSKILAHGLASEADLDALDTAARGHVGNAQTLLVPVIYFLTWARKPDNNGKRRISAPGGKLMSRAAPTTDDRPNTAPAYYLGRPACLWIAAARRTRAEGRLRGNHTRDEACEASRAPAQPGRTAASPP